MKNFTITVDSNTFNDGFDPDDPLDKIMLVEGERWIENRRRYNESTEK